MAGRPVTFTEQDYYQLPEDWNAELIEGDLVMAPAPDPAHERLVSQLMFRLADHLGRAGRDRILGSRIDIRIDAKSIVQPDVVVLPEGVRPTPRPWTIPVPAWVAEILSPGTKRRDRGVKLRLYRRKGIREAWLVDPDQPSIEVHDLEKDERTLFEDGAVAVSRVIPGFRVDVPEFLIV